MPSVQFCTHFEVPSEITINCVPLPDFWPVDGSIRTWKWCPPLRFGRRPSRVFKSLCPDRSRGRRSERHLIRPHYLHHHSALISPGASSSLGLRQAVLCPLTFLMDVFSQMHGSNSVIRATTMVK